ncbi:MAG TPA: diguanylate cyclase [Xanthobacteraceae bacterium]|nr:diguanylate cyclase [Xanthobacteraceae bacterium]
MTSPAAIGRSDSPVPDAIVRAEQVRLLFGGSPVVVLVNIPNALVASVLLGEIYPVPLTMAWVALMVTVTAARVALWRAFQRRQPLAPEDAETWGRGYALGAFATGCLWGLLGSVVLVTDNPVFYVFAVFVLGGMTAGAAMLDSPYPPAFYGFAAPAILPIIVALATKDGLVLLEMALLLAAFAAVLVFMGRDNNRRIVSNIRLRHTQTAIAEELRRRTEDLKKEVAEHKQVAQALEESNVRLRGVWATAQDAIVITNADAEVVAWNPAAERMFGFTTDEVLGRGIHGLLVPARYHAKVLQGFKRFKETGRGELLGKTVSVPALRKDGAEFPIDLSISAMQIGDSWHALGVARDISARVQREAELHEREKELKEAQRVAHLASWNWVAETNSFQWTEELYRIFGRDRGLPPPSLDELSHLLAPESYARILTALRECQVKGTPYELDLQLIRPDGGRAWIAARGEAERDASGKITRVRGTVLDITDRKQAEQNIARLNERMEANVEVLKRRDQDLMVTAQLSDLLQACHSTAEAIPVIATAAGNLFGDVAGALATVVSGSNELETVTQWGADAMLPRFNFDDCWALRTGQIYEVRRPSTGTLCHHFKHEPRGAYLCLPLTVRGETTGVLHVELGEGAAIDDDLRRRLLHFGDVIKLSLSNLRLRESLSEQAMRDQLTTLFNRRYLAEALPREIRRAMRDYTPLSAAIMDVDHFKRLNDTQGHEAGDAVLKGIGEVLRASLRTRDVACRYGGEEFLLLLPDCDIVDARGRLQEILDEIKGRTFTSRGQALPSITLSCGIAQLADKLATGDALVAAADEALYAAKRAGRDRIVLFSSEPRNTAPAA